MRAGLSRFTKDADEQPPDWALPATQVLLVLEGALTIASEGGERTYLAGEVFEMPAGRRHSEIAGPDGARYIAGRRYQSGS